MDQIEKKKSLHVETKASVGSRLQSLKKYLKIHRSYWIRVATLAILGVIGGRLLDEHRVLLHTRYVIYNWQTEKTYISKSSSLNTVFVAIDDDAFWKDELARRIPLKRDYLAKLVAAVSDADARVIALDFDLRQPISDGKPVSYPDYTKETNALLQVLKDVAEKRPVVLAESVDRAQNGPMQLQADIFDDFSFGDDDRNI
jgi:CHASE2 domain-containing sensor protein